LQVTLEAFAIDAAFELHVDARQLAHLAELPLSGGNIHHREPLTRPRSHETAGHAKVHDRRAALQCHVIADLHVQPLLRGRREKHRISRECIERPIRGWHADQIRRNAACLEDVDAEHRQCGALIRYGDIESEYGTRQRYAWLGRQTRIDGLVE
jgi:hypothetical protein